MLKNMTAFFSKKKEEREMANSIRLADLKIGDQAQMTKSFSADDVAGFARITGDSNPVHLDEEYAKTTVFGTRIVHGMLVGSLFSALFGTLLPGLGSIYVFQSLKFVRPVRLGEAVTATVTVKEILSEKRRAVFDCLAVNDRGETVLVGEAQLLPPGGEKA